MTGRAAEILYKDQVAGTLEETAGGGTRFVYGPEWREPIACCFPATRREHEWPTGLHPFFEHLGTEGWLREQQARVAHIAQEDDLGLLLRYGADCIGAVGVRPSPGAEQPPAFTEAAANPGRTVSGVQKKLLVTKAKGKDNFSPAEATGPAPYIAKFNSENIPTLVRNEALSLRWTAAILGADEVNTFTLGQVNHKGAWGDSWGDSWGSAWGKKSETALVVTRFDRAENGEKLRLEDFAQILGKPRGRDYSGKYDASYEDVAQVIREHSARPVIDLQKLLRRLIVFSLIGNCDAHLKNFSLLETTDGLRLSPVYDVLNTAVYPDYSQTLALSINGRKWPVDSVTRKTLEDFGLGIGIPAVAVKQSFEDIGRKARAASPIITPPGAEPPEGFINRFHEVVNNACLRILQE